jgi:predicted aspartyl protease
MDISNHADEMFLDSTPCFGVTGGNTCCYWTMNPCDSADSNIYFGALGSSDPKANKNLLQIPAEAKAKHGSSRVNVYALIDTGATHCFVNKNIVDKLGLKIHPLPNQQSAKLGNGMHMQLQGYTYVSLVMNGFRDEVKCFVAPLGDISLILGDEWLSSRNVVISYNPKRLHLTTNGHTVQLSGVQDITKYGLNSTIVDLFSETDDVLLTAVQFNNLITDGDCDGDITIAVVKSSTANSPISAGDDDADFPASAFDMEQFNVFKQSEVPTGVATMPPKPTAPGLMPSEALAAILRDFNDVFPTELPGVGPTREYGRNVPVHTIPLEPNCHPPFLPVRRYSPKEYQEMADQVKTLLEKGLIQPSSSPFGAPVLFVTKKDGTLRMCIDYRALNKLTVKNKYPIPRIDDLLDKLHGAQVFTSLDLLSGYWQIKMGDDDIPKTAFRTPQGHFEWKVLPFGLTNAPATFQSTMNTILGPVLGKFALVYLDDILIFSNNAADHEIHLRAVLDILRTHKFYVKESKCDFNKPEVKYLGHIVGRHGVKVDPAKVEAVANWPQPTTVTEVQAFLGVANYFHRFIPNHSTITSPLTDLTKGPQAGKKRNRSSPAISVLWNDAAQQAFDKIKAALCSEPVLQLPDFSKPFEVMCDASILGTGAVLIQDGHPIAYESHKLSPAEQNYTTGEQEMLAVIRALTVWRVYLEGPQFTVLTDHNPNTFFSTMKDLSRRQVRWSEFLSRFHFDWKYIPGPKNISDGLSRLIITKHAVKGDAEPLLATVTVSTTMTRAAAMRDKAQGVPHSTVGEGLRTLSDLEHRIVAAYATDPWYSKLANIKNLTQRDGLWYGLDNTISVPQDLKQVIIEEAHDTLTGAHLGITKTIKKIRRYYQWLDLNGDVTRWINSCQSCHRSKSHRTKSQGLLQPLPIPERRFGSISMDFITCLPVSPNKNDSIYVIVDRLTKYARFIPCKTTMDAEECARLFYSKWVADACGIPDTIVSDRDVKFTSRLWSDFTKLLGSKLLISTAFHPQTDGQTERMNRTLEEMLRAYVDPLMANWEELLPLVQHAYNDSVQISTSFTPYQAAFGLEPRMALTPSDQPKTVVVADLKVEIETILDKVKSNLARAQERQATFADQHRTEKTFNVGDEVYFSTQNLKLKQPKNKKLTSKKLLPRYIGPFKILECRGKVAYLLDLPVIMKVHPVVHVSLLYEYKRDARHKMAPPFCLLDDGSVEYEVDAVIDVRVTASGTPKHYLIKWFGWGTEHNSWEPAKGLSNCADLVKEFWDRRDA